MSYAASLQRRLRDTRKRATANPVSGRATPPRARDLPGFHPRRYPLHAGDKGQVHGGTCNITLCDRTGATFWNRGTFGFHCRVCAADINRGPGGHPPPLCVPVEAKPDLETMDRLYREMMEEMPSR